MITVNSNGRIIRITKRPSPKNAINRYCKVDPKNAVMSRSSIYMFEYNNETSES